MDCVPPPPLSLSLSCNDFYIQVDKLIPAGFIPQSPAEDGNNGFLKSSWILVMNFMEFSCMYWFNLKLYETIFTFCIWSDPVYTTGKTVNKVSL